MVNLNSDSLEVQEMISGSRGFLLPAKSIGLYIYTQNNSSRSYVVFHPESRMQPSFLVKTPVSA
ncbi:MULTISPECIES: hypothetical protein [unclassified Microcoleus]|uniref:hypothetical protein n=1 Tax=unclassified Microcoleus TaxID=2642155 RepID=UPI002FD29804